MKKSFFGFLVVLGVVSFTGCAEVTESLLSDDDIRIELRKNAEESMQYTHLIKKLDSNKVCKKDKPFLNRYLCWRYYEIGGDIWLTAKYHVLPDRLSTQLGQTLLIKNNVPVAIGNGGGFYYYKDKGKKTELGYNIIKGRMMPKKRAKLIHPNKERNRMFYEHVNIIPIPHDKIKMN